MPRSTDKIDFDHKGIGSVLAQHRLIVPLNQREYAWEETHATDLFKDFANAIASNNSYFLGTIVLTRGKDGQLEVSDGQQRLATTSILLAAIRDYFAETGQEGRAQSIEQEFLSKVDLKTQTTIPRLTLNVDDNAYFVARVLERPNSGPRMAAVAKKDSHKRIDRAATLASQHIVGTIQPFKATQRSDRLIELAEFIRDEAQVILVTVPDHINAFTMFETLNDRGLKASQADLLKNYLLSKAGEPRLREAQQQWAEMLGTLESIGESDMTVTYLRHVLICKYGPTKEREVFDKVRDQVNNEARVFEFLSTLAGAAQDYVALFNPEHARWNSFKTETRKHIAIIKNMGIEQIRPLMLATTRNFSKDEIRKAFRLFVAWSVRFLIVGRGGGGLLDRNYSVQAQKIEDREIKTTKELAKAMGDIVPNDREFEQAFGTARVSNSYLARYYLRAVEQRARNEQSPETVPSEDEEVLNLEHIVPANPEDKWPDMAPEVAAAFYRRIGNLALLQPEANSKIGNAPFSEKRKVLANSTLATTRMVAKKTSWGVTEIEERQRKLAEYAVETWSISVT